MHLTAIRFLRKFVRNPERLQIASPSHFELAEYGAALTAIGARNEANNIFKEVSVQEEPQVLLYRSFNLFSKWEYQKAVELLREYTVLVQDQPYKYAVGRLNYCAALVSAEDYEHSIKELQNLHNFCSKNDFPLLKTHINQLTAMSYLGLKDYKKAIGAISSDFKKIKNENSTQSFLISKWIKLATIYDGGAHDPKKELQDLINRSLEVQHWESFRDLSLRSSIYNKNKNDFLKVYFGTPYKSFRSGARVQAPDTWEIPQQFQVSNKTSGQKYLEWVSGASDNKSNSLKVGSIIHSTFQALSEDQFRPRPLGSLFSHLYPDDYFDPNSSPNRVSQAIFRLRSWCKTHKFDFQIIERDGLYQLHPGEQSGIMFGSQNLKLSKNESLLIKIQNSAISEHFTKTDVVPKYFANAMAFSRWTRWAISEGYIQTTGNTRSKSYSIKVPFAA